MKQLFTFTLLLSTILTKAQVTITRADFGNPGDTIYYAVDSTFQAPVNIGASGTNKSWDFTNGIVADMHDMTVVYDSTYDPLAPAGTNTIVVNQYEGQINYQINNAAARALSTNPFNPSEIVSFRIADFPMAYGKTFRDSSRFNAIMDAASLGLTGFDSIWLKIDVVNDVKCDAWGSLVTPKGTINVLRVKNNNLQKVGIFIKGAITFNQWTHFTDSINRLYIYTYLGNNAKYFVAQAYTDSLGNIQNLMVAENKGGAPAGVANIQSQKDNVNVFPNPSTDLFTIQFDNHSHLKTVAEISDITGKVIWTGETNGNEIQANLGAFGGGIYFCLLRNNAFAVTHKVMISR
jgi:hypothetical protein